MKKLITSTVLAGATALCTLAGAPSAQAQDNVTCSLILGCQMHYQQTPQLWTNQVHAGNELRDAAGRLVQSASTGYIATRPLVSPSAEAAFRAGLGGRADIKTLRTAGDQARLVRLRKVGDLAKLGRPIQKAAPTIGRVARIGKTGVRLGKGLTVGLAEEGLLATTGVTASDYYGPKMHLNMIEDQFKMIVKPGVQVIKGQNPLPDLKTHVKTRVDQRVNDVKAVVETVAVKGRAKRNFKKWKCGWAKTFKRRCK